MTCAYSLGKRRPGARLPFRIDPSTVEFHILESLHAEGHEMKMTMQLVERDIKFSDEAREIIRAAMATGRYKYEDEVVAAALYMLLQDMASKGEATEESMVVLEESRLTKCWRSCDRLLMRNSSGPRFKSSSETVRKKSKRWKHSFDPKTGSVVFTPVLAVNGGTSRPRGRLCIGPPIQSTGISWPNNRRKTRQVVRGLRKGMRHPPM